MRLHEIEARLAEIRADMEQRGDQITADELTAYETEVQQLTEERNGILQAAERRNGLLAQIAQGEGTTIRTFGATNQQPAQLQNPSESPEYRRAWLKNIAVRDGVPLFGEMTPEERSAFTTTTANSASVVPSVTMNMIIDLVESQSPMLADATPSAMSQGFSVPRRRSITQGDASGVAEGAANEDEQNNFDLLSLEGIEIKKHVVITRKMKFKSIDAFEAWLVNELAARIAVAKNRIIRNRLDGVAPAGGAVIANAGIAPANILTAQTYGDAAIRGMFALLKGNGERVVYANNKTIWNHLAGIEDGNHQKLFVPNSMVDPIIAGRIYGAAVKVDNEIADNVVYLGTKGEVLANDYDDLMIFNAIEPKTANEIKTAYSLFDAGLKNPESFVKATFTAPAA